MDYRDKFYEKYITTQTSNLYGEVDFKKVKGNFSIFENYFGKFLPEDKEVKIVDLGCGSGDLILWLQSIGFKNVSGVDYSREQVELARRIGVKNVFQGDLREFLKNNRKFDVIFMRDALEHFTKNEVIDILNLIRDSLVNEGVFVIQTINAENLLWGRLRHGDFTHEVAFTRNSLIQIFQVIGFNQIEIYPQPLIIHGLKSFVRRILWKLIEFVLKIYLLIETGSSAGIFTQNLIVVAKK